MSTKGGATLLGAMPDRAALVAALILERPLCEACIATKAGLSAAQLQAAVAAIEAHIKIHRASDRCRACGTVTMVLAINRPA